MVLPRFTDIYVYIERERVGGTVLSFGLELVMCCVVLQGLCF